MKTTPRRSPTPVWLLMVLALGVSAVATSMNPSDAVARTRPVNSEPLAGDPDTPEAPYPGGSKNVRVATAATDRSTVSADAAYKLQGITIYRYALLAAYWSVRLRGL